jgi:hypothetical protein
MKDEPPRAEKEAKREAARAKGRAHVVTVTLSQSKRREARSGRGCSPPPHVGSRSLAKLLAYFGVIGSPQKVHQSFMRRGILSVRVRSQLRMRSRQFGADEFNRRLQPSKLQFYIEVIVAEAVFGSPASEPSRERYCPKIVEFAVRQICMNPSAVKVGFHLPRHFNLEEVDRGFPTRGVTGHGAHP